MGLISLIVGIIIGVICAETLRPVLSAIWNHPILGTTLFVIGIIVAIIAVVALVVLTIIAIVAWWEK